MALTQLRDAYTIAKTRGISLEKVFRGMIDIKDHYSYVAINRKKINRTLRLIRKEKIKNMKSKYEIAR